MSTDDNISNNPTRLGGFELLEKIGEGGMGAVYRAKQTSLDRLVALKVLNARLASDEKYLDSFRREARSAAKLSHPNIIPVYDAGEADGSFYYAMEFVHGETLSKWVRRDGALPESLALEIALCVASALKYAWDREHLIHRDIKPENIIIDTEGNVKICDLGLAKNFGENTLLSLSGQAFGTPNYMSPEQARADRAVDCRSDIYSLGLTLYFAVTNEIPYHGGTATLVMARHMTEQLPDPRAHAPNLSPHLCQLLQKMAAKNVADRYQNWDDLIADIQLVRAGQPLAAAPLPLTASSIKVREVETAMEERAQPALSREASRPMPQPTAHDGRDGARPSMSQVSSFSPPPSFAPALSKKSLTPIYIMVGAILIVALGGVGGWFAFKGKQTQPSPSSQQPPLTITQDPKTQNLKPPDSPLDPPTPPPLPPPSEEAKRMMEQAHFLGANNPSEAELAQIVQILQTVFSLHAGTPEAAEAAQLLPAFRSRLEQAEREAAARREEERRAAEQRAREEEERAKALTIFNEVQKSFLEALAKRDYVEAEKIAQTAAANPLIESLKDRAESFAEIAPRLRNFWSALPQTLAPLKGKQVTVQNETGIFAGIEQGSIELEKKIGDSGAVIADIPLAQIPADELAALVASARPPADTLLTLAWLCFAENKPAESAKHLDAAEKAGADAKPARNLLAFISKGALEIEAEKILAQARTLIENKRWREARAALALLQQRYADTRVVAHGDAELRLLTDKIQAGEGQMAIAAVPAGSTVRTYPFGGDSVAFSPDGRYFLVGQNPPQLFDLATGIEVRSYRDQSSGRSKCVAFSPDGKIVAAAISYGFNLWETNSARLIRRSGGGDGSVVEAIAFSPDGRYLVSATYGKRITLWNVADGKEVRQFEGHKFSVYGVAYSSDGRFIATASTDKSVKVWDANSGKEIYTLTTPAWQRHVAFTPNGRMLVSGGDEEVARVWDLTTGKQLWALQGHSGRIQSLAVSPDGRFALTGGNDATVRLWNLANGSELLVLRGHIGAVTSVAFSPDGRLALSSATDATTRLWKLFDGQEPLLPLAAPNPMPPPPTTTNTERMPDGNFVKPKRADTPQTFLKIVSAKGDYVGGGKTYTYGSELNVSGGYNGVTVRVDGWTLNAQPPQNQTLAVGEYRDAKRAAFKGDAAGLDFGGKGRGCSSVHGRFVIWELEVVGGNITRLALDFVQHCEQPKNPPLFGSLRFNSNFGDEPESAPSATTKAPALSTPVPAFKWSADFDEGLAQARREGKVLFVLFFNNPFDSTKWTYIHNVIWDKSLQERYRKNFVCVTADVEKQSGKELAQKFGVTQFPQYWFFDANGKRIYSAEGYAPVDKIHAVLDQALESARAAPLSAPPAPSTIPQPNPTAPTPEEELRQRVNALARQLDLGIPTGSGRIAENELLRIGAPAIPHLREVARTASHPMQKSKVEAVIQKIESAANPIPPASGTASPSRPVPPPNPLGITPEEQKAMQDLLFNRQRQSQSSSNSQQQQQSARQIISELGLATTEVAGGVHVLDVQTNTVGAAAGIRAGDIITHLNNAVVRNAAELRTAFRNALTQNRDRHIPIQFRVQRGGNALTLTWQQQ